MKVAITGSVVTFPGGARLEKFTIVFRCDSCGGQYQLQSKYQDYPKPRCWRKKGKLHACSVCIAENRFPWPHVVEPRSWLVFSSAVGAGWYVGDDCQWSVDKYRARRFPNKSKAQVVADVWGGAVVPDSVKVDADKKEELSGVKG